jgi:hypothetical protein
MPKVSHIHSKNPTKDYSDVPAGLLWAIPIHECLEREEVKARARALQKKVVDELAEEHRRAIKLVASKPVP